jgi:hypothetical protein
MKASAPTTIYCPTDDPDLVWCAMGETRKIAEDYYTAAIIQGQCHAPPYRVVVQLKIDQHDGLPSIACH